MREIRERLVGMGVAMRKEGRDWSEKCHHFCSCSVVGRNLMETAATGDRVWHGMRVTKAEGE